MSKLKKVALLKKVGGLVSDISVIEEFGVSDRYSDEPFLNRYYAKVKGLPGLGDSGYGGGASFDKDKAMIKAACEAAERYCLAFYDKGSFVKDSAGRFGDRAMDISKVISFDDNKLNKNNTDSYNWIQGVSLFENKKLLIPSQLVFVPYKFPEWEKVIRLPISTGAATGISLDDALIRGILEVVERDAFIIHYLTKMCGERLDIAGNDRLLDIQKYFRKYRLEVLWINLPTDLGIHTFLTLIIDRTGIGPAVSAGLKSGLDPESVAIGSLEEACHSRPWIRSVLQSPFDWDDINSRSMKLKDIKERGLLWSRVSMIKNIYPWIRNKRITKMKNLKIISNGSLKHVLDAVEKSGHEIFYVDITRPEVERHGFKVIKAIILTLQPFYLDEEFPYLGGTRLYELPAKLGYRSRVLNKSDLNKLPHFFL